MNKAQLGLFNKNIFIGILASIVLPLIVFISFELFYWDKIFPGIKIANIAVENLTPEQAINVLSLEVQKPNKIILESDNQKFELLFDSFEFSYDIEKSVQRAFYLYRTGNIIYDFTSQVRSLYGKQNLPLKISLNENKLNDYLSVFAGQVSVEPILPTANLIDDKIIINNGALGKDVDIAQVKANIFQNLSKLDFSPIQIATVQVGTTLSKDEAGVFEKRAQKFVDKTLLLEFDYDTFSFSNNDLLTLLAPKDNYYESEIENIVTNIASQLNRRPQNAIFKFEEGKVKEFVPAKDGITVKTVGLKGAIVDALKQLENTDKVTASINIPVVTINPEVTNENVNNLGIKELIGRGTSRFRGSIYSRVHNISLASSRFNGALVPPGEIFSFNNTLGDVSSYTGYQQAYIIRDGKTVLGDGGGVCQVSTTLFRAVLDAGLPIVERRAHSYRVGYYEQDSLPGFDATVYAPTTDLKFKNDTPAHLLIQTTVNTITSSLVFEIYGSYDGRVSKTTKPVVSNVVPPPEDLYIDDPTLPVGTIKQIDYKAWGAKTVFDYEVKRNDEVIYSKTFYSNYHPWQAKFLKGTAPI